MGDLTANFSEHEFACQDGFCPHCGGCSPVDDRIVDICQEIRDYLEVPLKINSGFRCITYNRTIGSEDTSQHCRGKAVDIAIPFGVPPENFFDVCEEVLRGNTNDGGGGMGRYDTFVHLDVRNGGPARWDYRK